MSEILFPYQEHGAQWLQTKKVALLADEMGLGKSAQSIRAADAIGATRILVLCPAVARTNWHREFQKFSNVPRSFDVVFTRSSKLQSQNSVICSYDLAALSVPKFFGTFDLLILDEAHFLKSVDTKRTKAVFGKEGFVRYAKRIWALTGTPAPNHAGELWPLLYTFGYVPEPYDRFLEKYCDYIDTTFGRQITGTKLSALPELKSTLDKLMLRRKTVDVIKELPELFYNDIVVEPGQVNLPLESSFAHFFFPSNREKELKALLDSEKKMIEETTNKVGFGKDGMKILEGLATSVATLRRYVGLQKVEPVADLVEDELSWGAYEKIVIFAIHRDVIEGLRKRLNKFGVVTLYGGTPADKRTKHIDKFQKDPKVRVFIGNIHAAGTAITLTAANQVLFLEQDWVPGNNAQAAKRCHRIGQTKPVFVRMVGLAGSFDEKISNILKRKARELTQLFDKNSLQNEIG